jgi:hypothetical protein
MVSTWVHQAWGLEWLMLLCFKVCSTRMVAALAYLMYKWFFDTSARCIYGAYRLEIMFCVDWIFFFSERCWYAVDTSDKLDIVVAQGVWSMNMKALVACCTDIYLYRHLWLQSLGFGARVDLCRYKCSSGIRVWNMEKWCLIFVYEIQPMLLHLYTGIIYN